MVEQNRLLPDRAGARQKNLAPGGNRAM